MSVKVASVSDVLFDKKEALSIITVENDFATAQITPYGASVLSFIPKCSGGSDLLWVSPTAFFNGKKPVRGGIPICWPWFGQHPNHSELPAHGFVRNLIWSLDGVKNLTSGATELVLSVKSNAKTLEIWPYSFHLSLTITIGKMLSLCLTTTNLSDQEMVLTEAFHSYFKVSDAREVAVSGFKNSLQIDTLSKPNTSECLQAEQLIFSPPIDSVFLNHAKDIVIKDAGLLRDICIVGKEGSMSSVVWSPGSEIVKGFADIPNEQWASFLCVESGNVFSDVIRLKPRETHRLKIRLQMV